MKSRIHKYHTEQQSICKKLLFLLAIAFGLIGKAQCTLSLTSPTITPSGCGQSNGTITGATGTGGSGNYSYTWNGGSISGTSSYTNGVGTYSLQVIDNVTSCTFTQFFTIPGAGAPPPPVVNVSSSSACVGGLITMTATPVAGTIYNWAEANGLSGTGNTYTVSNIPSSPNPYVVSVTAASAGCVSPASTVTIIVNPLPNVSINSVAPGCVPLCANFTATATPAISTYMWDFGNGQTSPVASPYACYTVAGTSIVTLSATAANGCVGTATTSVVTYPSPVVDFASNTTAGCSALPVNFTDVSTISVGTITSWYWDFGNGNLSSTILPPSQIYSNISNNNNAFYSVSLQATSNEGCISTQTKNNYIEVYANPTVGYTLMQDPAPYTWDAYPTYSNNVATALWSWGDGTNSTGLYPSHTYSAAARYSICVIVTNLAGCSDSICQNDTIYRLAQNNSTSGTMLYVNVLNSISGIYTASYLNLQISLYPNPGNGSFVIETNSTEKQTLQLYDVNGRMVLSQIINGKTTIDANQLTAGIYKLSIISSEGVANKKLVIVK